MEQYCKLQFFVGIQSAKNTISINFLCFSDDQNLILKTSI